MHCKTFVGYIILLALTKYGQSLSVTKNFVKVFPKEINVCESDNGFHNTVLDQMDLVTGGVNLDESKSIVSDSVDLLKGGIENIVEKLRDLTDPAALLNLSIQTVEGLPLQVVLELLTDLCGALMSTGVYQALVTPDINELNFLLITPTQNYFFPITAAEQMYNSPAFDKSKKVVLFATGWFTNVNSSSTIDKMTNAYRCRNDSNIIIIDTAKYLKTLYTWAAYNTEAVGYEIAVGLAQLVKFVSVDKLHLIGHSLGAHIMGSAGRRFKQLTGTSIPRLTGLDPSNPCFKNGFRLNGIQSTDAAFVDIIHTDVGILGKPDPMGHIDSYAGGLQPIANGTLSFIDSHIRVVDYYTESVYPGNGNNFIASKCVSFNSLENSAKNCNGRTVAVGYATPNSSQGIFTFDVNGSSPYGKGNSVANSIANLKCVKSS